MSTHLKAFYQAIQKWVDAGLPKHEFFEKTSALCTNLGVYLAHQKFEDNYERYAVTSRTFADMRSQFGRAGLDPVYPFNGGSHGSFVIEERYKNPRRLAWIREHAA